MRPVSAVAVFLFLLPGLSAAEPPPKSSAVVPTKGLVREIQATDRSMIDLTLREGFTSMVFLPEGEGIIAVAGGGGRTKEGETLWPIDWSEGQPVLSVRPAIAGIETNLHITSSSGVTYSFMLRELKTAQPDLKVYLAGDPKPASAKTVKFVPATEVEQLRLELQRTMAAMDDTQRQAGEAVESFKKQYAARLKHYTVANTPPFNITGMWHDGEFTRITTTATELPVIYEMKDGHPAEVNFQVQDGHVYLVPKVLGAGYLKLGTKRLAFSPPAQGN
jgi:Conjugal transfer protein